MARAPKFRSCRKGVVAWQIRWDAFDSNRYRGTVPSPRILVSWVAIDKAGKSKFADLAKQHFEKKKRVAGARSTATNQLDVLKVILSENRIGPRYTSIDHV